MPKKKTNNQVSYDTPPERTPNTPYSPITAGSSFQPEQPENNAIELEKNYEYTAKKHASNFPVGPLHTSQKNLDAHNQNQYHNDNYYGQARVAHVNNEITHHRSNEFEIKYKSQNANKAETTDKKRTEFDLNEFYRKDARKENFGARKFHTQHNYQDIANMLEKHRKQEGFAGVLQDQHGYSIDIGQGWPDSDLLAEGPDNTDVFQGLPGYEPQQPASGISQVNTTLSKNPQSKPGLSAIGVHPPGPINIKPIPFPIGPDPETCPCVLVETTNNTTDSLLASTPPPSIPIVTGQLGFIPVIFVPYCPGEKADSENMMRTMFPTATPVPYPCSACSQHEAIVGNKFLDISQLNNIEQIRQALGQANLGLLNVPVKSQALRRNRKIQRRKSE